VIEGGISIFLASLVAVFTVGGGVVMIATYVRLLRVLRTRLPDLWQKLGSPTLAFQTIPHAYFSRRKTFAFVYLGRFHEVDDLEVQKLCNRLRLSSALVLVVFAAWMIFILTGNLAGHR
jgi:hypothetical protein